MKNLMIVAAMATLVAGCATAKRCAMKFPVRQYDSVSIQYKPGETVYSHDTVTVDCDTVQPQAPGHQRTVRVPCPPSTHRVDTFEKESVRKVEDTARLKVAEAKATKAELFRNIAIGVTGILLLACTFLYFKNRKKA